MEHLAGQHGGQGPSSVEASGSILGLTDGNNFNCHEVHGFEGSELEFSAAMMEGGRGDEDGGCGCLERDGGGLAGSPGRQANRPANHEYVGEGGRVLLDCGGTFQARVCGDGKDGNIGLNDQDERETGCASPLGKEGEGLSGKGFQFLHSFMMDSGEGMVSFDDAGGLLKNDDEDIGELVEHFEPEVSESKVEFAAGEFQMPSSMVESGELSPGFERDIEMVARSSEGRSVRPEIHEFACDGVPITFHHDGTCAGRVSEDGKDDNIGLNDRNDHEISCSVLPSKNELSAQGFELLSSVMDCRESLVTFDSGGLMKDDGEECGGFMGHFEGGVIDAKDEFAPRELELLPAMTESGDLSSGFEAYTATLAGGSHRNGESADYDHLRDAVRVSYDCDGTYGERVPDCETNENAGLINHDERETSCSSPSSINTLSSNGLQFLPSMMDSGESLGGFETSLTAEVGATGFRFPSLDSGEPLSGFQTLLTAESPSRTPERPANYEHIRNCGNVSFDCQIAVANIMPADNNSGSLGVDVEIDHPSSTVSEVKDELVAGELPVIECGDPLDCFETSVPGEASGWHPEPTGNVDDGSERICIPFECYPVDEKNKFVGLNRQGEEPTSSSIPSSKTESETNELQGLQSVMEISDSVGCESILIEASEMYHEQPVNEQLPFIGTNVSIDFDVTNVDKSPLSREDEILESNVQDQQETDPTLLHDKNECAPDTYESSPSVTESRYVLCGSETSVKTVSSAGPPERPVKHNLGNGVRVSFECRSHSSPKGAEKILRDEKSSVERQKEVPSPLWVKWRGKWETAIKCCSNDCPMATLKSKPSYSKKNHVVVYFPSTRTFLWVDAQHTRPISESPVPLLRGTHASGLDAVKDESLPRRRMLIKLGGEMLDISDRLHIKAVVVSSQNVNVWKTFAKEAAAATQYEELGGLLVRLHLTIHPAYIKPGWMERRYSFWKEESAKSTSAAAVQKLTRELINAVLWDEVAPLWNLPEQPELDPEWEHWKGEAFEDKNSDDDAVPKVGDPVKLENGSELKTPVPMGSGSKRFKEQARARRQSKQSLDMMENLKQKRTKSNSRSLDLPVGMATSTLGHATTAFRSPLVQPSQVLQGQHAITTKSLRSENCFEVIPGLTLASSSIDTTPVKKETFTLVESSSRIVTAQGNHLLSPNLGDKQSTSSIIPNQLGAVVLPGGSWDELPFCNSGLCSAFLKKKNRRCNRQAKDVLTYCGKHKHLAKLGSAGEDLASDGGIAWESGLCSAHTRKDSIRCEQNTVEGSSFCLIHVLLDRCKTSDKNEEIAGGEEQSDISVAANLSPLEEARCNGITARGVRCTHKPKDGFSFCVKHSTQGIVVQVEEPLTLTSARGFEGPLKRAKIPQMDRLKEAEKRIGSTLANPPHSSTGFGSGQRSFTPTESMSAGNDILSRKRKFVSSFFPSESTQTVKSSLSPKQDALESRAHISGRCAGRTTRNDEQCSFRARAGHIHCTKHLMAIDGQRQLKDEELKFSSPSLSQDILERYLTSVEGIPADADASESHRLLLNGLTAEAAKDYTKLEELLRSVTMEMSKLQTVLQGGTDMKDVGLNAAVQLLLSEDGGGQEGRMPVRCGLCDIDFPIKGDLGRHWTDSHKKDVSLFVKGYACRACSRLYSRKHTVRRHWRKRHQSLPVMSPDWVAVCLLCHLHFADHNLLLDHVVSEHSHNLSSTGLKNLALLNKAENTLEPEAAEPLECPECHEEFSTHWDLFDHKERKHKSLGTEVSSARVVNTEARKVGNMKNSPSQSVPKYFGCRICGKKFSTVTELRQHKQTEHLSLSSGGTTQVGSIAKKPADLESGRLKLPVRRKADELIAGSGPTLSARRNKKRFRAKADKRTNEKDPEIEKEALLFRMKAAVQTAQLRTIRQSKRSDASTARPRKALYSLTKGGQMLPFDAETKCKTFPDDEELLEMARSVCCQSKLLATLDQRFSKIPDQLSERVNQVCSAANVGLEWQAQGYICGRGCKQLNPGNNFDKQSLICDPLAAVTDGPKLGGKIENVVSESSAGRYCPDLSNGQEPVPVVCFVDDDVENNWTRTQGSGSSPSETSKPWDDFNYITKRVLDPSLGLDPENYKVGCSCEKDQCSPEGCDHVDFFDNDNVGALDIYGKPMNGRFPYDEKGCIILEEGYLVYECNSSCRCQHTCQNRVLQKGVTVKLEVFRTSQKGWAVRAGQMIPRGTFVCEYVGEVLRDEEANKRGERYDQVGCSYLYDIDAHLDTTGKAGRSKPFVIDATKHGNVARFINHSCSPNLINYQVLVDSMDCQLAHIGLFASQDIDVGEELAYDYRYRLLPGRGCPCHCGAPNCRGRLY